MGNYFKDISITESDIVRSNWQAIKASRSHDYHDAFFDQAKLLEQGGDAAAALVLVLIGSAASLRMSLDHPDGPFTMFAHFSTWRSAAIDDFSDDHLEVFAKVLPDIEDPWLKARIGDILWTQKKNYKAAGIAIDAYLAASIKSDADEQLKVEVELVERAMQLASSLGKANDYLSRTIQFIEELLARPEIKNSRFLGADLMELLRDKKIGDAARYAVLCNEIAATAESEKDWNLARRYLEIKAKWHAMVKDTDAEAATQHRIAESFISQAQQAIDRENPGHFEAAHYLQSAWTILRNIPGTEVQRKEVLKQQLIYQAKAQDGFIKDEHEFDLTEFYELGVKSVEGKSLFEALLSFAFCNPVASVDFLEKTARENLQKFVFKHLFRGVMYDSSGKVVYVQPQSATFSSDDGALVRSDMLETARLGQMLFGAGTIRAGVRQILSEHPVRVHDLLRFLQNNPFVPLGREMIFARGLYAGLIGDFLVATHLLIPQLENSVRYVLNDHGVVTVYADQYGLQKEYDLNTLLYGELGKKCEEIFGKDLLFALQGLLVEFPGANLRNTMAHGRLDHDEFYSPHCAYFWWLTLKLCLIPYQNARSNARGDNSSEEQE